MTIKKRNYGIDLLRLLSMMFVVLLHSLLKGGILENAIINSTQYKIAWFLEIIAYCAVDIFAMISGYVQYNEKEKPFKLDNLLKLWIEVVFYGLIVTLIFDFIYPDQISLNDYFRSALPIHSGLYWYFTAYTALYFFVPLLNKGIKSFKRESLYKLFWMFIIVFSIYDFFDGRFVGGGYNIIWLIILYIIGASIKKCKIGDRLSNIKLFILIIIFVLITYFQKIYGTEFVLFSIEIKKGMFISYTSPTILGIAMCLLIFFKRIHFSKTCRSIISFAAPTAFAVYILNCHYYIWKYIMNDLFINIANKSFLKVAIYPLAFSLLFVILTVFVDRFRILIFKILKIDKIVSLISKKVSILFKASTKFM